MHTDQLPNDTHMQDEHLQLRETLQVIERVLAERQVGLMN